MAAALTGQGGTDAATESEAVATVHLQHLQWRASASSKALPWDELAVGATVEAKFRAMSGGRTYYRGRIVATDGDGCRLLAVERAPRG